VRYWLYKCKRRPNASGASGDWSSEVFSGSEAVRWPGHRASAAAEVHRALDHLVAPGDVVACLQTDDRALVGFCRVVELVGEAGDRDLTLQPIHHFSEPFPIHAARRGTPLEHSAALIGRVTLRELPRGEMEQLVELTDAPKRVLRGRPAAKRGDSGARGASRSRADRAPR
jgi:hypothetical protein